MDKHPTWTRYEMDDLRSRLEVAVDRVWHAMMQFGTACGRAASALDAYTWAYGPIEEHQSGGEEG